ncbi:MAG: DUF2231 domain-containing protein [Melioribacteraceae bacterium]
MQLIPDWAPNIHPMIVHFPIALLIAAVLLDVLGLFLKRFNWLEKSAFVLYAIGTIMLIITFFTGRSASDGLDIPANVISSVNDHADWAEITMWFFIIYSIVRLSVGFWLKKLNKTIVVPVVLVAFVGVYFLFHTAEYGAKLVYGHGLGTGNISRIEKTETKNGQKEEQVSDSIFTKSNGGSWKLIAVQGTAFVLKEKFKWIKGSADKLDPMYDKDNSALMLHPADEGFFVYDNKIKSVQISVKINLDDLNGQIELVHHFIDQNNYDFLRVGNGKIILARKTNEQENIFGEDRYAKKGWIEVKVVSDGKHFRGYVDNKIIVHGHDDEPKPGSVGLRITGKGSVSIKEIMAESLR